MLFLENIPNFDGNFGSCLQGWKNYAQNGHRWDFKANGDQILENGQVISNPRRAVQTAL